MADGDDHAVVIDVILVFHYEPPVMSKFRIHIAQIISTVIRRLKTQQAQSPESMCLNLERRRGLIDSVCHGPRRNVDVGSLLESEAIDGGSIFSDNVTDMNAMLHDLIDILDDARLPVRMQQHPATDCVISIGRFDELSCRVIESEELVIALPHLELRELLDVEHSRVQLHVCFEATICDGARDSDLPVPVDGDHGICEYISFLGEALSQRESCNFAVNRGVLACVRHSLVPFCL